MTADLTNPASTSCFRVKVDRADLGIFSSCEGLGFELLMETREEGGNNDFVWHLPTRMKYTNIKLTRPVVEDTGAVAAWFATMTTGLETATAQIEAMRPDGSVVWTWELHRVLPVRWQGPSFSADGSKLALEVLELAYHGFTPAGSHA